MRTIASISDAAPQELHNWLMTNVPKWGTVKARVYAEDGTVLYKRLAKSSHQSPRLIEMEKGSRKYGVEITTTWLASYVRVDLLGDALADDAESWRASWLKVRERLAASGLWPSLLKDRIELGLDMGLDKIKRGNELYWMRHEEPFKSMEDGYKAWIDAMRIFEPRLIHKNDRGEDFVNPGVLWHMDKPAQVKKMRFVRGDYNERYLAQIAEALANKTVLSLRSRYKYDISFDYVPPCNAWYSEEYKDCGNGHYYLVLDATHAMFEEND